MTVPFRYYALRISETDTTFEHGNLLRGASLNKSCLVNPLHGVVVANEALRPRPQVSAPSRTSRSP